MIEVDNTTLEDLVAKRENAQLEVFTLGRFTLRLAGTDIPDNWGRDKAIQLFQFFIISRNRTALHKEQIIDRLWEEDGTDQDFKVALHGVNKMLKSKEATRGNSKFIQRQGASYRLNTEAIWIDSQAMEGFIECGNKLESENSEMAIVSYQYAVSLYKGIFLPNRVYEDWTTMERERLQMLALGAHVSLSELLLKEQPNEAIRLTEEALNIDPTWEEAFRIQMMAHMLNGNRPQAIKTYQRCQQILHHEFGIDPLPETQKLYQQLRS